MKKGILLSLAASLLVSEVRATITVTPASGGLNISADKAANATLPGWISLGAITIDEQNGSGGRADFAAGTGVTLVLKAPTGFQFNTAQRPSVSFTSGRDITSASANVTDSSTLTITLTVPTVANNDKLIIGSTTNLQIRPTAGTPLASGDIYRPSTGGGTAVMLGLTTATNALGDGGTSFGALSEVAGAVTNWALVTQPSGATVGEVFANQPLLKTLDQFGNVSSTGLPATLNVVATLSSGTGVLLGTVTNNVGSTGGNGVTTYSDLRIDDAGQNRRLTFSATGFTNIVSAQFDVARGTQVITFDPIPNKTYGDPTFGIRATSTSGLQINFSVVSGPATVSGTNVTLTGYGAVTIRASQTGNANWGSATAVEQSFNVAQAPVVVTWSNPADIVYGTALSTTQLNATANVAGTFTYSPTAGTVLNAGAGQTLSVTFVPSNTNYATANKTVAINVSKASQTITFGSLANKTYGDADFSVSATASSSLAVSFSILSGPATISGSTVSLTGLGTVTVRASQTGNTNYNAAPDVDQSFQVVQPAASITWTNPADIVYGTALDTTQLNATSPVAGTFAYTPAAGTILNAGAAQTLSVVFTPTDTNYSGASATVSINVLKAGQTISFGALTNKTYGDADFSVNATASSGLSVNFSIVSGPATISGSTVSLTGVGTVLVRASQAGDTNYDSAIDVDQSFNVAQPTASITWTNPADIVYGTVLGATQLNATASVAGTFTYTPAEGTVLNAGSGQTLSVSFAPTDTNYSGGNATVSINVLKADQTITFDSLTNKTYGDSDFAVSATTSSGLPVSFSIVSGPADVSGSTISLTGAGSVTVRAAQAGNTNYNAALNVDQTFTVAQAAAFLGWSNPADITYGIPLGVGQLNATSTIAGTFTYTPTNGTILDAGTNQTLSVVFVPEDTNYANANASVSINVLKATPVIIWSNPADITYGTALSTTQLAATSAVSGTFVYTPASAAVLDAGTNQLSVTFSPADTNNYNSANAQVDLIVDKAALTVVVDDKTRDAGTTNPVFTGTISGVQNADDISATYACAATLASAAGTYPITATLNDPNSRLGNYSVSITNGTLTVVEVAPAASASIVAEVLTNGHVLLHLQGASTNHVYAVEAVDQLGDAWQPLGNAVKVSGNILFEDSNTSASKTRFYRAVGH